MKNTCNYCKDDMFCTEVKAAFLDSEFCPYCGRFIGENVYHRSEPAIVSEKDCSFGNESKETHPAYAQMSFSRQSGGHSSLYGSAIKHQDTIVMQVRQSEKIVSSYSERFYSSGIPLIEVRMSQSQFAELITTMNMGSGTPVTLEALRGKQYPKCDEIGVSERANRNLNQKMNKLADEISSGSQRVQEILNKKGSILKAERKEIKNIYSTLMQDLRDNLPYLHDCMTEAYDKTAASAKADIEAFYSNAITKMGIEAMNAKQLTVDAMGEIE